MYVYMYTLYIYIYIYIYLYIYTYMVQDPGKVIFNFSKYEISDYQKRVLTKGLNFNLLPKYLY